MLYGSTANINILLIQCGGGRRRPNLKLVPTCRVAVAKQLQVGENINKMTWQVKG